MHEIGWPRADSLQRAHSSHCAGVHAQRGARAVCAAKNTLRTTGGLIGSAVQFRVEQGIRGDSGLWTIHDSLSSNQLLVVLLNLASWDSKV